MDCREWHVDMEVCITYTFVSNNPYSESIFQIPLCFQIIEEIFLEKILGVFPNMLEQYTISQEPNFGE